MSRTIVWVSAGAASAVAAKLTLAETRENVELCYLPKLEGQGFFPVGHRTSTLTVKQFNGLIELLYKYGAENGVRWTEPELRDAV